MLYFIVDCRSAALALLVETALPRQDMRTSRSTKGRRWLLAALLLALTACAAGPGPAAPGARPTAGTLRVAIVLPGAIDDRSWSQSGYEGLQLIERELDAQVAFAANVADADAPAALRRFAADGYDLVIGHGAQFYAPAEALAPSYPRVKFAVVGNFPGNNRNLGAINFRNRENAYLVGVVAAMKSRSGRLAYIGGVANTSQLDALDALERGARAARPDIVISPLWVGSWNDEGRAAELAREAVRAGADVLIQNAAGAGRAVLREADAAGVYAIGWVQDQHEHAPGRVLTSAIQRVPVLLREAASLVQRGRWEGKLYRLGIQEGALDLAPSYGLLSDDELDRLAATRAKIIAGQIELGP